MALSQQRVFLLFLDRVQLEFIKIRRLRWVLSCNGSLFREV